MYVHHRLGESSSTGCRSSQLVLPPDPLTVSQGESGVWVSLPGIGGPEVGERVLLQGVEVEEITCAATVSLGSSYLRLSGVPVGLVATGPGISSPYLYPPLPHLSRRVDDPTPVYLSPTGAWLTVVEGGPTDLRGEQPVLLPSSEGEWWPGVVYLRLPGVWSSMWTGTVTLRPGWWAGQPLVLWDTPHPVAEIRGGRLRLETGTVAAMTLRGGGSRMRLAYQIVHQVAEAGDRVQLPGTPGRPVQIQLVALHYHDRRQNLHQTAELTWQVWGRPPTTLSWAPGGYSPRQWWARLTEAGCRVTTEGLEIWETLRLSPEDDHLPDPLPPPPGETVDLDGRPAIVAQSWADGVTIEGGVLTHGPSLAQSWADGVTIEGGVLTHGPSLAYSRRLPARWTVTEELGRRLGIRSTGYCRQLPIRDPDPGWPSTLYLRADECGPVQTEGGRVWSVLWYPDHQTSERLSSTVLPTWSGRHPRSLSLSVTDGTGGRVSVPLETVWRVDELS